MEDKNNTINTPKDTPEATKNTDKAQEHISLDVDNDIRVVIKSKTDGVIFDQDCCTCINIILNNDNEIATSFVGVHNEFIIKELIRAQKAYFKALKKTLKEERKRGKEILNNEENKEKEEKKKQQEEYIHHIKEYGTTDTSTTAQNQKQSKTIDSDTGSFDHICDENGCRLIKKRINPKDSPDTTITPHQPNKKKSVTKTNSKDTTK